MISHAIYSLYSRIWPNLFLFFFTNVKNKESNSSLKTHFQISISLFNCKILDTDLVSIKQKRRKISIELGMSKTWQINLENSKDGHGKDSIC